MFRIPFEKCLFCASGRSTGGHMRFYSNLSAIKGRRNSILRKWITQFGGGNSKRTNITGTATSPPTPKAAISDIRRLLALARPERYRIAGGIILLAISSGVTMSVPFCIGRIIDMIFKGESASSSNSDAEASSREMERRQKITAAIENLTTFCYALIGIFVLGAAANFGRVYFMQTAGALVVNRLRTRVFASILRQEIAFFDKTKTGELVNRLSNDASLVGYATTMNISDGLRSVVTGCGGAVMMWYTSPSLSIIGFAIVPPVAVIAVAYGRFLRTLTKRMNDALADATQVAEERISNIRTVRAFCAEGNEEKRYTNKVTSVMSLAYSDAFARAGFFGSAGLSGNLIMLAILYKGGEFVASGQISIGALSSFLLYAIYVGASISGLGGFYTELMRGMGASERLFELLERKPMIPASGGIYVSPVDLKGEIQFRKVTFAYPGRVNIDVLKDFDLLVPAGRVTAIVGPSGSGKSTIAAMLLRYYEATKGTVFLDGKDIRTLDPNGLRSYIGTVSQEPVLFSCSVGENIAYGAGDNAPRMQDVIEAAKQANAYDFIMRLPHQFDTVVGERGVLLSGGQRQRIAIARALLKNPKILLMDEATSALDAESEHLVKQALDRLFYESRRTVLVIAHRLSTIRNADQIAVLQGGRVIELGTYDRLLRSPDGVFRKLVEKQTERADGLVDTIPETSQT